jgi:hypothetical protein
VSPNQTTNVVPLPDAETWSLIAKKYLDYLLTGDPRAACYYLEHRLAVLKLSHPPKGLQQAIHEEQKRRGFTGQILFHLTD